MRDKQNNTLTHWAVCPECRGLGKRTIVPRIKKRKPTRSLWNIFSIKKSTAPLPKQTDICFACSGSGLVSSESVTPVTTDYPHLAIIGGGIGGVALAVACMHRGIPFTLYERDRNFNARSQGYGLTLQQASKAIEALGIFSLPSGITSTRHVVHKTDGKIIGEWGMRKWLKDAPVEKTTKRKNVHISRQSLRSSLLAELGDSPHIKWRHKLTKFTKNKNGGINLEFEVDDKTTQDTADLIVGADGIRSTVRELLIGEQKTPLQYLGCIVILGICPLKSLDNTKSPLLDSATVFQTVNGHERIYMMPYDTKTIMWQLSFPLSETEAQELSAQGAKAMKTEALRRLGDWHSPVAEILQATGTKDITGYPVYDRKLLDPRLLQHSGNATIIGDSAHPMSPFKGQGANQALLDALALARDISIKCAKDSNWRERGLRETVLNSFEKEMLTRTASKVEASRRAVELLHSNAVLHEGDDPRGRGI